MQTRRNILKGAIAAAFTPLLAKLGIRRDSPQPAGIPMPAPEPGSALANAGHYFGDWTEMPCAVPLKPLVAVTFNAEGKLKPAANGDTVIGFVLGPGPTPGMAKVAINGGWH